MIQQNTLLAISHWNSSGLSFTITGDHEIVILKAFCSSLKYAMLLYLQPAN